MASWMDPREFGDLRAAAENAAAHGARVAMDPKKLIEVLDERDRLRAALVRQEFDVVEALAQAQGMEKDPEYGYPTGDHTAETMAQSMIDYCARLRAVAATAATRAALGLGRVLVTTHRVHRRSAPAAAGAHPGHCPDGRAGASLRSHHGRAPGWRGSLGRLVVVDLTGRGGAPTVHQVAQGTVGRRCRSASGHSECRGMRDASPSGLVGIVGPWV